MAQKTVQYIGDNDIHRAEITVALSSDNIVPNDNAYFSIQLGYGSGSIPNGSIQFTNIQLEVNDKATDFEYEDEAVTRLRYGKFYQRSTTWESGQKINNANRVSLHHNLVPKMRATPSVTINALAVYNDPSALLGVTSIFGTSKEVLGTFLTSNSTLIDSAYIYKYTADARLY